jgi:hypothetical protein
VNKEIRNLKKKLGNLQKGNYRKNQQEIKIVSSRLDELLHGEEIMWRQWSRVTWLKEGDQNTRYFHKPMGEKIKTRSQSSRKRTVQ